jgi:hypothetical protein
MFDGRIPPPPHRSPVVMIILLPLLPIPCLTGTLAPVPPLQDHVRGQVNHADTCQLPHLPLSRGKGEARRGGRTAAAANANAGMIPILPGDASAMG